MTDTDRLAALLETCSPNTSYADAFEENQWLPFAARLLAAGVTLVPTPPDALDVERLAMVMRDMCDCIRSDEDATVWARDIAEEYAKEPTP